MRIWNLGSLFMYKNMVPKDLGELCAYQRNHVPGSIFRPFVGLTFWPRLLEFHPSMEDEERYMEVLDIENPSFDHLDRVGVMGSLFKQFILNV